ncbi:hypothetical protein Pla123a_08940 [Posidoniimonas polymericola]|uniref:HEAT repeat domain-containing protein n=1 Tax=Posidoniimonas polymericola TaxID=2528002 RepID=A0A5C5YT19_9BACT|nr:hypothetical protein [Posidoniimonas polymericola]TWT78105.1 hypothetical protein Pla123a_08940 [Posidoniimonas polymericola]
MHFLSCLRSLFCLTVAWVLAAPGLAAAQEDEINLRQLALKRTAVQRMIKSPVSGADRELFEQYFDRYYFPTMQQTDPESLGELAGMRDDLLNRYIYDAHPTVQKELTEKAYNWASKVFAASRAPAPMRYNAALILGSLDEKYATKNDPSVVPLGKANVMLCKVVKFRAKLPTYIEVAALVGLERHTKYFAALGANEQKATAIVLLEAAGQEDFRPGTGREVQDWIKLQAANAIANMGVAGKDGVFAQAVAKLVTDPDVDLATRSTAAMLLERMTLDDMPPAVANEVVGGVKNLACAVAASEREAAEKFVEVQRRRGGLGSALEKSNRFHADEKGWVYERAGLASQLEQLKKGLAAVKPLAGQDAESLKTIESAVQNAIDTANKTSNIDLDVTDSVRSMADQIDRVAGCQASGEGEEDAADLLGAN